MDAVELEIRITGISERKYRASLRKAPENLQGSLVFELPDNVEPPADGSYWRNVRRRSAPLDGSPLAALLEQGSALFELVFAKDLYAAFRQAFERARAEDLWLRVQFSFEAAPEAVEWPWEALCSQDGNSLARLRRPRVSIERRLVGLRQGQPPLLPSPGRKTALVAGASPPGLDPIDVKGEMKWIRSALRKAEVDLKLSRTEGNLDRTLAAGERFDLVHFCGHGDFESGHGGLWLEGEGGKAVRRSGRELVAYLGGPVPFVFLNCCHGGRASFAPLAGVAESLLQAGTGAVLAMRREISDPAAAKLARKLYQELAQGERLTRAVASARRTILTGDGEWAVPVLYLAGDDFPLLPSAPAEGTAAAPVAAPVAAPLLAPPRPRLALFAALLGVALITVAGLAAAHLTIVSGGQSQEIRPEETYSAATGKKNREEPPAPPPPAAREPQPSSSALTTRETKKAESGQSPPVPKSASLLESTDPRCPSPATVDFHFIWVRRGDFLPGEDKGDPDFRPRHQVTLSEDYCLSRDETTREQWAKVMGLPPPSPADARLPVVKITWDEVQAFIRILNERDHDQQPYRLPTEAEWERAARAGTTTLFSFGDDEHQLARYGNCLSRKGALKPIGKLDPNAWGFHDMHGNVWEWVADHWYSYDSQPAIDPLGRNVNASHVRRGGAYDSAPDNCWSAARHNLGHERMKTVGFRLARDPITIR